MLQALVMNNLELKNHPLHQLTQPLQLLLVLLFDMLRYVNSWCHLYQFVRSSWCAICINLSNCLLMLVIKKEALFALRNNGGEEAISAIIESLRTKSDSFKHDMLLESKWVKRLEKINGNIQGYFEDKICLAHLTISKFL